VYALGPLQFQEVPYHSTGAKKNISLLQMFIGKGITTVIRVSQKKSVNKSAGY